MTILAKGSHKKCKKSGENYFLLEASTEKCIYGEKKKKKKKKSYHLCSHVCLLGWSQDNSHLPQLILELPLDVLATVNEILAVDLTCAVGLCLAYSVLAEMDNHLQW